MLKKSELKILAISIPDNDAFMSHHVIDKFQNKKVK
jgi:hypothetical protein